MLENPVTMPQWPKRKAKPYRDIKSKGKPDRRNYRQKETSKHRQPDTYTAVKVEKRKS